MKLISERITIEELPDAERLQTKNLHEVVEELLSGKQN
jgi:hypothetical protein